MTNKYSIVGIARSTGKVLEGEYKGQPYDNTLLHVIIPADESKGQVGQLCDVFKVKTSSLDFKPELGQFIIPTYNRYGKIDNVILCN